MKTAKNLLVGIARVEAQCTCVAFKKRNSRLDSGVL